MNMRTISKVIRGAAVLLYFIYGIGVSAETPSQEEYYTTAKRGESTAAAQEADELRRQTIASIEDLLKKTQGQNARTFELYMRLADLFAERHDYLRDLEISRFESSYDRWRSKNDQGNEPQIDHLGSRAELTKAANAYREIARLFPKHQRSDEALYALSKTLVRLGNDNAELYFKQLFDNHPQSPLIPEARVAAGDFYFERHKTQAASEQYKKAMEFKEHSVYPYAVYKLGWSYYNFEAGDQNESDSNLQKALLSFKLVIHVAQNNKQFAGRINLREEALKDIVMVYADLGQADEAWAYFQEIGEKDRFYDLLQKMGEMMAAQGKHETAAALLERLLKEAPQRSSNPDVFKLLTSLYDQQQQHQMVMQTLKRWQQSMTQGQQWHAAHHNSIEALTAATKLLKNASYRYAVMYHKQGFDSKSNELLRHAEDFYQFFLSHFGQEEEAYEARYYLADLQFDRGDYANAAQNYLAVSRQKPRDAKYSQDAALNAVLAAHKLVQAEIKGQPEPDTNTSAKINKPLEISSAKKLLISSIDHFALHFPEDEKSSGLRFEVAFIYFHHGHHDSAVKRFETIVQDYPKHALAIQSATAIMNFFIVSERYQEALDWQKTFMSWQAPAQVKKLKSAVTAFYRDAVFLRAQQLESEKRFADAAQLFLRFQREFPKDRDADKSLYNAIQNELRAARPQQAIELGQTFLETYAQSPFRSDIIADIATTQESLGRFEDAAESYYRLVKEFPADHRSPDSLLNAALIWSKLNQKPRAQKSYAHFIRAYPKHQRVAAAWFAQAEVLEALAQDEQALSAYEHYLSLKESPEAMLAEARAVVLRSKTRSDGRTGLVDYRTRLLATPADQNQHARSLIAALMFDALTARHKRFVESSFNPQKDLAKQAAAQQRELESLVEAYQAVMSVGAPEFVVASLYRLGEAHEGFYQALYNAQPPASMSERDVFAFRSELEAAAFPLRDQAYEFYESAYKRSEEVETFSQWTQKTYEKMTELAPAKHRPIQAQWLSPSYLGLELIHQPALLGLSLNAKGE